MPLTAPLPRIPVSLITGFLGSGKTTLLNRLLNTPEMARSLVLVNELGQISVDTDLITRRGETMIELSNGCVCCTLNEDLSTTLFGFVERQARGELPPFRRVLIETTGLANAGPIIRVIEEDPQVKAHYQLDNVITTVDGVLGTKNLDVHAESVEQAAVADFLVLTKLDLIADPAATAALKERLTRLNRGARLLEGHRGDELLAPLVRGGNREHALDVRNWTPCACSAGTCGHEHPHEGHGDPRPPSSRHDQHISSFCLVRERPLSRESLDRLWQALSAHADANLLRVKGLVNVEEQPDQPVVIQGVQTLYSALETLPAWPSEDRRTRIVFIGWKLDQNFFEQLLPQ